MHRALGRLEAALALAGNKGGYLVGDRASYADLVFWAWGWVFECGGLAGVDGGEGGGGGGDPWERYPNVGRWQGRMNARESVGRVVGEWERVKLEYV